MTIELPAQPTMSEYEQRRWVELNAHWNKAPRQLMPPKAREALEAAGNRTRAATTRAGRKVAEKTPDKVKAAGGFVADAALEPVMRATARLLDYATELVTEFTDPEKVLAYHRSQGRAVDTIGDLRHLDLKHLDDYTRRMSLTLRGVGATEGAALGFLATVPVVGTGVSIGLDVLLGHLLSSAVATRVAYSYGFDPTDPDQQELIAKMVRRSYKEQGVKAGGVREAANAFKAGQGRVRWSNKLRKDEKLLAAGEKLMKQFNSAPVPVQKVVTKMPGLAVITAAGFNQHMLADVTKQARAFAATRHLAEKYDLPLPEKLIDSASDALDADEA